MAAHRLLGDGVASHPRDHDRNRNLPLAEAGNLDRPGQIRGRVLERVLDGVFGDLDLEAHLAVREFVDLRLHELPIQSDGWRPAGRQAPQPGRTMEGPDRDRFPGARWPPARPGA